MLHSATLKFSSHIIGLYSKLELNTKQVQEMQFFYREFYRDIDAMDFEAFKKAQKRKLWFEVQALNFLEPFVQALDKAEQHARS